MKKGLGLVIVLVAAMLVFANVASASVFIDFESGGALPIGVTQNSGVIENQLVGLPYPDKTTGSGSFFRNTVGGAPDKGTLSFDFDVIAADFYWSGLTGVDMNGAIYAGNNGTGTQIDGGSATGSQAIWEHVFAGPFGTPARSMSFWSTNPVVVNLGGNMAVDNITLYTANDTLPTGFQHNNVVPEPASMSLLGLGLLGLVRRYRRK